jgi:hypothetical protein
VWADAHSYPMNYLKLVDITFDPVGHHNPYLDTPWKRLSWLLFGRNELPTPPVETHPALMITRLGHSAATLFLFEFGPLALPLIVAGFVRAMRRERALALILAAALALSLVVPCLVHTGFMLGVFLIPCTLLCALFAADGLAAALDWIGERVRNRGPAVAALAILAPVLVALPAHLIRLYAYDHPLGPKHNMQAPEHDQREVRTLIPTLRGYRGPGQFGEQAMVAIPLGALVSADWHQMTILRYYQVVKGLRPDLTILPPKPGILKHWQETHSLAEHPLVFVDRSPRTEPYLAGADSLALPWDQWIFVVRSPLEGLPAN